jgi:soluble lytic murein transglycosylase-like protein
MWLLRVCLVAVCALIAAAQERAEKAAPMERSIDTQMRSVELQRAAAERQRQSLAEQYPSFWNRAPVVTTSQTLPPPECPPMDPNQLKTIIDREAARQKLDAKLVQAVVETESAMLPCAVSPAGALGLMQLMPDTAGSLGVKDPFDPEQNISGGTQFLRQMLDRYGGDLAKALAAYNAGPARVDASSGIPDIQETQSYVKKIMEKIKPVPLLQ